MKLHWFVLQMTPNEIFEPMLQKVYLASGTNSFESTFNWRSGSFTDFVTRKIKDAKIETIGFNMISIHLCTNPKDSYKIFEKILTVEVAAEENIYRKFNQTDEQALNSFFVRKAKEGLEKIYLQKNDIPYNFLLEIINGFEQNGYSNTWTQQAKKIKNLGVEIKLVAQSTIQSFTLKFQVFQNDNLIFSKIILETLPSPTFYYYEFKEMKVLKTTIQILRRDKSLLVSIPFKEFQKFIS